MADKKPDYNVKKIEDIIKTYEERSDELESDVKDIQTQHLELWLDAIKPHIFKDGKYDYSLLDKKDIKEKVHKKWYKGYQSRLIDYLTQGMDSSAKAQFEKRLKNDKKFEKRQMKMHWNLDEPTLRKYVEAGSDLTHDNVIKAIVSPHLKKYISEMGPGTYEHIEPEHIPDLLKHVGAAQHLEDLHRTADRQYVPAVVNLLNYWRHNEKAPVPKNVILEQAKELQENGTPGLDLFLKEKYKKK